VPVVHHILLAVAAIALAGAGLRVASLAAPEGLERVLAAAALAFAAAVVETLVLGLAGLGGSGWALGAAAVLTWLAARAAPAPALSPLVELSRWWRALPLGSRLVTGGLAGAWVIWVAWLLRHPTLGFDTVLYHASEAAVWVGNGHPAGTDLILRGLPVTNYPVTDEVFLTWGMGLAHSFVPASLLVPPQVVLLGLATWCGLRALELPRLACALGSAALCALPPVIGWQSNGAAPDPAALAWLVTCAALCVASRRRPALLVPAVVAAGLAIGTKTTTGPLTIVALGAALWFHRGRLGAMWRPLALATLLATGCGGVWYLRNLLDHGSPLWPFVAAPWGTPAPASVQAVDVSFAQNARETIDALGDLYTSRFLGGIVLLAGAALAPLLRWRERAVWLAWGAAMGSLVIWLNAPFTGVPPLSVRVNEGVFSTTRYLLPALAASVLALALAAAGRGLGAIAARLVLAAAIGIELAQTFRLGFPAMPSAWTPIAGAVAGVAVAGATHALRGRGSPIGGRRARPALFAAALGVGALLAVPASGYVHRHAQSRVLASGLSRWMAARPDDGRPVASAPVVIATLAGDRLRHRLRPIPERTSCADMRARARAGYVVLYVAAPPSPEVVALGGCIRRPPSYSDLQFRAWAPEGE
jgi:hypothetical protein